MKNLSTFTRLLIWAAIGLIIGTAAAFALVGMDKGELCFYIGVAALIVGLLSSLKGTPGSSTANDKEGNTLYYNANVAVDEEASSKAMEKHFHDNHVVDANAFGAFLVAAGILMAVISHLSVSGNL